MTRAQEICTVFVALAALTVCGTASAAGGQFIATQGRGRGSDLTRIYDGRGRLVKKLDRYGRTMVFDAEHNLFVGENSATGGKYLVWRYPYLGGTNWGPAEKYCEVDGRPRALAVDAAPGTLYIGLDEGWKSNVYKCTRKGETPALFCGVNDGSRQIQDMEVGPDGKVWLGLYAWGYLRFPLAGGHTPELRIENGGKAGGFAFGPDRNGDGRPELYGSVNKTVKDFGYYDPNTGKQLGKLLTDPALTNYCMTFGPDRNGDGVNDIYIVNYDDRIRIYDGSTGAKLSEMAQGASNIYVTGTVPPPRTRTPKRDAARPTGTPPGPPAGLLAQWNFDEGSGNTVRDSSGNRRHGRIFGPKWVKQGKGFALSFDGLDDYLDCGSSDKIGIRGPLAIEAWVKPTRKAHGEACLFGESLGTYLITYYNTEVCFWYISGGDNGIKGPLTLGEWNHVVATFDGKRLGIWTNGRLAGSRESKYKTYKPGGHFRVGIEGRPDLPKFKGMLDSVRIYNRPLSDREVVSHFKAEAEEHGHDPRWFNRVKVTPYPYLDRGKVVVQADYRRLLPLQGKGRIDTTLARKAAPEVVLRRQSIHPLPGSPGVVDVTLSCDGLDPGDYLVRVILQDDKGARPVEDFSFSYPAEPRPLPSPARRGAAALTPTRKPVPFAVKVTREGGFTVTIKNQPYPFQSRISWPNGKFNRLTPGNQPHPGNETSWQTSLRTLRKGKYQVKAGGKFYTIQRLIEVFPTHVYVKDRYTNTTQQDLGLLIYNETPLKRGQVRESLLSGHDRRGRQTDVQADYGPSTFFTDASTGMGILPVDDVYVVQAVPYVDWNGAAGVCTEKFALPPGKSYTLEWAVYPTGSGDYYDFINAFRKVEGRSGTTRDVQGVIGRRSTPSPAMVKRLGMKIAIIPSISNALDDPKLYIEGIEFMDFPKEMAFLKQQAADSKKMFPGLKVVFHIAHSLYCTNNPDRFADSRVILADGSQSAWGDGSTFGKERQAAGWKWWIFYPTPGNSFHDAMMKSVDVMMDDMGMDGGFMDGFFAGYQGRWSYDTDLRWDGHSAEIDPRTKTITRKVNSVLLLSQPSMIAYARKIRDKGGVVLANNCVFTRSIANEKYIVFNNECASGPELHLAPNVMALANAWGPVLRTESDVYLDILDKLRWGELWFSYGEPYGSFSDKNSLTLAARQFPMTFEEIRSGLVRGRERIVTMNPGVYGWPGNRSLHAVYKFDGRGAPASHDFLTTVGKAGVRTELKFGRNESAVIEPIPLEIETTSPVNTRTLRYDAAGVRLLLNSHGPIVLRVRSGAFPIRARAAYRITAGGASTTITERNGTLTVPLKLDGQIEVLIE